MEEKNSKSNKNSTLKKIIISILLICFLCCLFSSPYIGEFSFNYSVDARGEVLDVWGTILSYLVSSIVLGLISYATLYILIMIIAVYILKMDIYDAADETMKILGKAIIFIMFIFSILDMFSIFQIV